MPLLLKGLSAALRTPGQKSTPGSVDSSGPAREGRSPNGSSARRQSRRYRLSGARTARQQQRRAGPHCGSFAQKKAATFDRDSLYNSNLSCSASEPGLRFLSGRLNESDHQRIFSRRRKSSWSVGCYARRSGRQNSLPVHATALSVSHSG